MTKEKGKKIAKVEKVITIESLLTEDVVKEAFERMVKELPNITIMICVYRDRNGDTNWKVTSNAPTDVLIAMLEQVKLALLTSGGQEEGEDEQQ